MTNRTSGALSALLLLVSALVTAPAFAQQPSGPATASSGDLSGIWQLDADNEAFPQSQWSAETLPFTPAGREAFNNNKPGKGPRKVPPAVGNDPIGGANPPGLMRAIIYPRLFEMVQTKEKVVQLFEFGRIWRALYTDGRPVPDDVAAGPYWYGYSVGHWEGVTLVINSLALDERAWLDEWGTPFSAEARFEERWRRAAPDRLEMTLKVHDPVMYARDWTSSVMSYRLQRPPAEPQEIIFAPMDEAVFNQDIRDPAGLPAK